MKKFILTFAGLLLLISCAADEKTLQTESTIPTTTIVNETLAENEIEKPIKKMPLHDLTLLEQGDEKNLWQFKIHALDFGTEKVLTNKVFVINMSLPANWIKVAGETWIAKDGNTLYFPYDIKDEKNPNIGLVAPKIDDEIIDEYWNASSDKLDLITHTFPPFSERTLETTLLFDYITVNDRQWLIRYATDFPDTSQYFCNVISVYEDKYQIRLAFDLGDSVDAVPESTKEFVRSILEGFEIVRVEEVEGD